MGKLRGKSNQGTSLSSKKGSQTSGQPNSNPLHARSRSEFQKNFTRRISWGLLAGLVTLSGLSGCSSDATQPGSPSLPPQTSDGGAPKVQTAQGPTAPDSTKPVILSNGAAIALQKIDQTYYHEVEGTLSPDSFEAFELSTQGLPISEKKRLYSEKVREIFKTFQKQVPALRLSQIEEVTYFKFLVPYEPELLRSLKGVQLPYGVYLTPVTLDLDSLRSAREASRWAQKQFAETEPSAPASRVDRESALSGLKAIRALEFVQQVEAELQSSPLGKNQKVDGSSVLLGITDTGITFNHPTFLSKNSPQKNRIEYMKDFTGEGRMYFSPQSKISLSESTSLSNDPKGGYAVQLSGNLIETPPLPELPRGDRFKKVENLKLKVPTFVFEALQAASAAGAASASETLETMTAKIGVLTESSLDSKEDPVDINANGSKKDQFFALYLPGAAGGKVIVDFNGNLDLRDDVALSDWNTSRELAPVVSEKIGLHIENDELPIPPAEDGNPRTTPVASASLVGFDPGNHGSHVAGIAAGSSTLSNASSLTLARGVAPEAKILMNRVCANNTGCSATQAMVDLAVRGQAELVNMSLGGLSPFNDGLSVQDTLVNRLVSQLGTQFFISAGNSGPGKQTVGSPSVARLSLSIGATATPRMVQSQYLYPGPATQLDQDFMLFFSSRGPTASGGFKPNLSAPGTELSSIQLNSAAGAKSGLAVYWGTSMAAPTASGAYALFLDGIKKYNSAYPEKKLSTDPLVLRNVLMESARPFDVQSFDPSTGQIQKGQYTWIDQGRGMIDLLSAWSLLENFRDEALPTAVQMRSGQPVELDYDVVSLSKVNGIAYDGSRVSASKVPSVGSGIVFDLDGKENFKSISVQRKLPISALKSAEGAELLKQLKTTSDDFEFKTLYHGSSAAQKIEWLKVGTLAQPDCLRSGTQPFTLFGTGIDFEVSTEGKTQVTPHDISQLHVCIDRDQVDQSLEPGDHGALLIAYRRVGGKVSRVPSFTVPVYLNVPNQSLAGQNAYLAEKSVESFGVSRNYVQVPTGTQLVKVTLEVPALKLNSKGRLAEGEHCSGVELMALLGQNIKKPFKERKFARVSNCEADGTPITDPSRLKLSYSTSLYGNPDQEKGGIESGLGAGSTPTPGIWDLHVFGSYKYPLSQYKLRVDYVNSTLNPLILKGDESVLSQSVQFEVKDSSFPFKLDASASQWLTQGLYDSHSAQVKAKESVYVKSGIGVMRKYPAETKKVAITTGESPENDIDLAVLECSATATQPDSELCKVIESSGGASDVESVSFEPQPDRLYAVRVDGYEIHAGDGKFTSTELILLGSEKFDLSLSSTASANGTGTRYEVRLSDPSQVIQKSRAFSSSLYLESGYSVLGRMNLISEDGTLLNSIPAQIRRPTL